jgi:hypothetical protein
VNASMGDWTATLALGCRCAYGPDSTRFFHLAAFKHPRSKKTTSTQSRYHLINRDTLVDQPTNQPTMFSSSSSNPLPVAHTHHQRASGTQVQFEHWRVVPGGQPNRQQVITGGGVAKVPSGTGLPLATAAKPATRAKRVKRVDFISSINR